MNDGSSSAPMLIVKPVFIFPYILLSSLFYYTGYFLLCVVLLSFMVAGALEAFGVRVSYSFMFSMFVLILGIIVPAISLFTMAETYKKTEYIFLKDKIEYCEGFWDIEEKTLFYKDIREIHLRRHPVQRLFNLGSIVISTAGSYQAQIFLTDIQNPQEIYQKIKELISS